jgi:hypothetical protein
MYDSDHGDVYCKDYRGCSCFEAYYRGGLMNNSCGGWRGQRDALVAGLGLAVYFATCREMKLLLDTNYGPRFRGNW